MLPLTFFDVEVEKEEKSIGISDKGGTYTKTREQENKK